MPHFNAAVGANASPTMAATDGEDQRFDEELRDDPPAAGAERVTDRDLGVAGGRPRVDQRPDVHAGDDQHQQDRQVRHGEISSQVRSPGDSPP